MPLNEMVHLISRPRKIIQTFELHNGGPFPHQTIRSIQTSKLIVYQGERGRAEQNSCTLEVELFEQHFNFCESVVMDW